VRRQAWCAALFVGLALATPGWAQKSLKSFGAIAPGDITNKPIDLSGAVAPIAPETGKPFSLNNFFSRFAIPGVANRVAVSPLPPPAAFPSTQYRNFVLPTTPRTSK
jgi:hypothetical protein